MGVTMYHINTDTGQVNKCHAKFQCKFKSEDGSASPHFVFKHDAIIAAEAVMEKVYGEGGLGASSEKAKLAKSQLDEKIAQWNEVDQPTDYNEDEIKAITSTMEDSINIFEKSGIFDEAHAKLTGKEGSGKYALKIRKAVEAGKFYKAEDMLDEVLTASNHYKSNNSMPVDRTSAAHTSFASSKETLALANNRVQNAQNLKDLQEEQRGTLKSKVANVKTRLTKLRYDLVPDDLEGDK